MLPLWLQFQYLYGRQYHKKKICTTFTQIFNATVVATSGLKCHIAKPRHFGASAVQCAQIARILDFGSRLGQNWVHI